MQFMTNLPEPLECPVDDVASVPRRFGVGVLMILMTAFAVLFATMRTFGAPPEIFLVVAGLFLAVTLAQILLFQGKKPRQASMLAGGVVFPLECVAVAAWESRNARNGGDAFVAIVGSVFCTVPGGVLFGYLAGCIMAGVFFVQERHHRRKTQPAEISFLPLTETDFDTLCAWVRYRPFFDLWSQGQFNYPLDHEQLQARFTSATPDNPDRLAFKAVCGEMQEMVAMVELAGIDRERSRANIELAIVDPSRNDRADISGKLLREIVREAFGRQRLYWLRVVLHHSAVESLECFRKLGFYGLDRPANAPQEACDYIMLARSNRY